MTRNAPGIESIDNGGKNKQERETSLREIRRLWEHKWYSTDNSTKSASRTGNESVGNPHVGNMTSKPRYPGTVPGSTSGGMKWRFHWCACAR